MWLQVDQAALTGESLPVKKYTNDVCFSGSTIKQGEKHAVVYATGANTFFGRAAALIGSTNNVANLQKIMTKIGGTCLVTIGVWIVIELAVQFGYYRHACAGGESMFPLYVCPYQPQQQDLFDSALISDIPVSVQHVLLRLVLERASPAGLHSIGSCFCSLTTT